MAALNQFLISIADAGRELLGLTRGEQKSDPEQLKRLCDELLSTRGEASGTAVAREVVDGYRALDPADQVAFFTALNERFAIDEDRLVQAFEAFRAGRDYHTRTRLAMAVEAPRQELFRRINMAPGGTGTLVQLRADLLRHSKEIPALANVDFDLKHLLASWFNRGFLTLARIDWRSRANVLEKLIQYESVHAIRDWHDLRRRLEDDRRCFAFFHPALPDEPLIFVEIALTEGMTASIEPLIDVASPTVDTAAADTAVFYSINNCRAGLRGISFGNFLIKQVVVELAHELPAIKTYCTLSPIPGFRRWLAELMREPGKPPLQAGDADLLQALDQSDWLTDADALRDTLLRLGAHYLLHAKRGAKPRDPVARFHLSNGARLQRLNWLADRSAKGLAESAGLMVNYVYDPARIERNHEAYIKEHQVVASSALYRLAK